MTSTTEKRETIAAATILFAAYGGGHVAMLQPVAAELRKRGYVVTFLALTTAAGFLRQCGEPYFSFMDFPEAADDDVQAYGRELVGAPQTDSAVPDAESVAYHGICFRELVNNHGLDGAHALFAEQGRQAFLPVDTMRRLIRRLSPCVVIATNSPRTERALVLAARKEGVPAICAVDMFALQEVKWIGKKDFADRICVLNEAVRDMFLGCGRQTGEIKITGNPVFDDLRSPDCLKGGLKMRKEKNWADKKVILWASQVEPGQHPFTGTNGDPSLPSRVETELRRIVAAREDWHLVIRYHPSQKVKFTAGDNVSHSPKEEDLTPLLFAVDVVITLTSTVALQASIAGTPAISVDCSIFTDDAPFSRMGITTGVLQLEDIEDTLKTVISSGATKHNAVSGSDTRTATKQIADIAEELIRI